MSGKKDRGLDVTAAGTPLALPGTSTRRKVGPVERGIGEAVRAAKADDKLTGADEGAVQLAKTLAYTVDWCRANAEPHTLTLAAARLSELLSKLQLEPSARAPKGVKGGIDWDSELANLGAPSESAGAPQSRDTTQP